MALTNSKASNERFTIEARVGGGASGDIFKAIDAESGCEVALKLLRHTSTPSEKARFRREIQVISEQRHPNIVNYVAHGEWSDGRLYLAMEWLDGEDLAKRTRHAPLGMRDATEVVRRAAQALAAIHARGIVHRDVKPENLLISKYRAIFHQTNHKQIWNAQTLRFRLCEAASIIGRRHDRLCRHTLVPFA